MLPDHEIHDAITSGHIGINPYVADNLQPASLDITIGDEILIPGRRNDAKIFPLPRAIQVGEFALASTAEEVRLPADISARLEGRSSWGRLGLVVHVTAGFIDPGFHGQITLELKNVGSQPIHVAPGDRIGQLSFTRLSSPSRHPYNGNYQNQHGPTVSAIRNIPVEARLTPEEAELRAAVKDKMTRERLSIRDVALVTGVNYGPVYRLLTGTGGAPEVCITELRKWLNG